MNKNDTAKGLLAVLANALSPGMVLDEITILGMLNIIQQVQRSLEEAGPTQTKL